MIKDNIFDHNQLLAHRSKPEGLMELSRWRIKRRAPISKKKRPAWPALPQGKMSRNEGRGVDRGLSHEGHSFNRY